MVRMPTSKSPVLAVNEISPSLAEICASVCILMTVALNAMERPEASVLRVGA